MCGTHAYIGLQEDYMVTHIKKEYDFTNAILLKPGERIKPTETKGLRVELKEYDPKRDKDIIEKIQKWVGKTHRYEWYASGYNFKTGIRDICFERINLIQGE